MILTREMQRKPRESFITDTCSITGTLTNSETKKLLKDTKESQFLADTYANEHNSFATLLVLGESKIKMRFYMYE